MIKESFNLHIKFYKFVLDLKEKFMMAKEVGRNKPLIHSKTFWAGVIAIVTAIGGVYSGEMDMQTALQLGMTGIIGIFLRQGIKD